MSTSQDPRLERNEEKSRYELWLDDKLAGTLKTRPAADAHATVLVATRVDPAFEGRGYGSRLVARALSDARASGTKVIVECEFAQGYLQRHPEEQDLVLTA
ncbi:MAG TPA: GNAT family N-acetyltransferase [Candidatus Limnocylindria bacterium]|nr:GNAT family N-acetyltransferase [Candidatus Limnocylindria bacterium]